MQKQKTTGLRTAAKDYVPVVHRACDKVKGISELLKELERSINVYGKSQDRSRLKN